MNSIAVISDAFNNLSDLGSSLVGILGVKLSNRPPTRNILMAMEGMSIYHLLWCRLYIWCWP